MEEHEIKRAVVHYLASNAINLAGGAKEDKIYFVSERFDNLHDVKERIVHGGLMDIVADLIEKGEFFGEPLDGDRRRTKYWVGVDLKVMEHEGDVAQGIETDVVYENGRLIVEPQEIERKEYLNDIRNYAGFRSAAELLEVATGEGELDQIANTLFGCAQINRVDHL